MKNLEGNRLDEELDLKSSKTASRRFVGSNPTPSFNDAHQRFRHQYTLNPSSADAARAWPRISGKQLAGSQNTKQNKRPQDGTLGPFFIGSKERKERSNMSPTASPPIREYSQASPKSPSPMRAFETFLGDAFLLREKLEVETAKVMEVIDLLSDIGQPVRV